MQFILVLFMLATFAVVVVGVIAMAVNGKLNKNHSKMTLTILGSGCPSVDLERHGPSALIDCGVDAKILIDCGAWPSPCIPFASGSISTGDRGSTPGNGRCFGR